ncbi:paraquat-inducible protein A [Pedobacter sp. Du54]|uniref:paraquat-inducible protein A n=1 Tax=Pedobacter anseongensis TaxID=3133439 RepID=UPI003095EE35
MQETKQKAKRKLIPHLLVILGLGILFAGECYCGYQLYTLSREQEQVKEDYSMVNNITFGVFSIDLWRDRIADMVNAKIKGFRVTNEQKALMREQIEKQLHIMVTEVVKEFNMPQKSLGGKLKKLAFNSFVDPKELHAEVPGFANTIMKRINSPRATRTLKNIATNKFEELADQTYDSTITAINTVKSQTYRKYNVNDNKSFNKQIETQLTNIRKVTYNYAYGMLAFVAGVIVVWILLRKKVHLHTALFVMSLFFALALLIVGITVSIIEVDARLSSLEIFLMGEKIRFENQVLFFQSKSILGVAEVLIKQPKPDSITVGILILLFVITLPILRITARGIHMLCKPLIAENKITRYLAFESGKWDMADVMVVGILMTYIGLNGILKSQLQDLNLKNEFLSTTSVNYTSLQPGYIIFVGYVTFAYILSYLLKKVRCAPNKIHHDH